MRYLKTDRISSIAADEENASYPAANLSDRHPQRPWKATSADATLTVAVGGNADCIAFYRTNAVSATITVKNAAGTTVLWGPQTFDLTGIFDFYEFFTQDGFRQNRLMVLYDEHYDAHQVVIELAALEGEILYAGVLRAGLVRTIDDPKFGAREYLVDFSVRDRHPNGADYYDLGEIVVGYELNVSMERDGQFFPLMHRLAKEIGETPIFWQITTEDTPEWTVFGKFDGLPAGRHTLPENSEASIKIVEVI